MQFASSVVYRSSSAVYVAEQTCIGRWSLGQTIVKCSRINILTFKKDKTLVDRQHKRIYVLLNPLISTIFFLFLIYTTWKETKTKKKTIEKTNPNILLCYVSTHTERCYTFIHFFHLLLSFENSFAFDELLQ